MDGYENLDVDMDARRTHVPTVILITVLVTQTVLLWWSSLVHSPTHLEVFHLPAGLSHLELHRFDLFRVNPPLVRMIAALPMFMTGYHANWSAYDQNALIRAEVPVGIDIMMSNGHQFVWQVIMARWACIPFVLIGSYVCYAWAKQLYGVVAAIIALLLWCSCPYVLGHGSVITPDAHAAGAGIAASFLFWRWLRKPTWNRTFAAGVVLGIAELTKYTLLVYYPLWLVLWPIYRYSSSNIRSKKQLLHEGGMMLVVVSLSVLVINLGYEFEDSFCPLGNYSFQSSLLMGTVSHDDNCEIGGNRFSDTWLACVPVPLPANYVRGIDMQRRDFETGIYSYLHGKWRIGGWWYFFLFALGIKLPLGTWLLIFMAVILSAVYSQMRADWQNEIVLILPIVVILTVVSSQSGIGIHSRYVIPVLPFVFIWASKAGFVIEKQQPILSAIIILGLTWSIGSSLWQYPHSLAYFNEIVGNPRNGFRYLAKSDCSWGQDLLFLKAWQSRHLEAHSLQLAHCGPFDPRLAGIEFTLPPIGPTEKEHSGNITTDQLGPKPGWYAIDVCFLLGGDPLSAADGKGEWIEPSKIQEGYDLSYFLRFIPVATAGHSIYIYHITIDEANRVRRELGLPELEAAAANGKAERREQHG